MGLGNVTRVINISMSGCNFEFADAVFVLCKRMSVIHTTEVYSCDPAGEAVLRIETKEGEKHTCVCVCRRRERAVFTESTQLRVKWMMCAVCAWNWALCLSVSSAEASSSAFTGQMRVL